MGSMGERAGSANSGNKRIETISAGNEQAGWVMTSDRHSLVYSSRNGKCEFKKSSTGVDFESFSGNDPETIIEAV